MAGLLTARESETPHGSAEQFVCAIFSVQLCSLKKIYLYTYVYIYFLLREEPNNNNFFKVFFF